MAIKYVSYGSPFTRGLTCYAVVNTRTEARRIYEDMSAILERYGFVSVMDLNDLLGVDRGNYRDNNLGWWSLSSFLVEELSTGDFCICLKEATEIKKRTNSPSRILESIKSYDENREYLCVIMGRVGPTGKTWLCNRLKEEGYNAVELTEDIYALVNYTDNANHVAINSGSKTITVILNESYKRSDDE